MPPLSLTLVLPGRDLMRAQPVLAFGWDVNSLAAFSMASLSLAASMVPRGSARFRRISMRHRAMGHHPIAQAIMWRTVTMMMAEAMAMSASKRTLCLRRSILGCVSSPLLPGQARLCRLLFPVRSNVDLVPTAAALGADHVPAAVRDFCFSRVAPYVDQRGVSDMRR